MWTLKQVWDNFLSFVFWQVWQVFWKVFWHVWQVWGNFKSLLELDNWSNSACGTSFSVHGDAFPPSSSGFEVMRNNLGQFWQRDNWSNGCSSRCISSLVIRRKECDDHFWQCSLIMTQARHSWNLSTLDYCNFYISKKHCSCTGCLCCSSGIYVAHWCFLNLLLYITLL